MASSKYVAGKHLGV